MDTNLLRQRSMALPDAGREHAMPIALPAYDVDALGDAGHVRPDDQVRRPAARALPWSFQRLLDVAVPDPMRPGLFASLCPPPCVATHVPNFSMAFGKCTYPNVRREGALTA
jgi:hypothetical protein